MTTAYGQPDKSLISCGFTRLDLFTSTCFCLSWCVAASVILGANGFWLRSILNPPQRKLIRLIINVEAQTAFNPGYPLTKRAIYYCSRMISAQHGPIFTNSEYGKIRKVYSIWVCTHPTKEFQNTLIRYSIRPEQLIGNSPNAKIVISPDSTVSGVIDTSVFPECLMPRMLIDNICTFCAKALFLELCVYYKTLAGKLHPRTC